MNSINKAIVPTLALTLMTGCAEMAVLTGAALSGAGLADGDMETAVLGGIIYESGMQQVSGEDVDIERTMNAGLQMGTAADLGSGELALSAITRGASDPFGLQSAFGDESSYSEASTTSTSVSTTSAGSASDCEPYPVSCQQAGAKMQQFLNQLQSDGFSGITDAASKMACGLMVGIEVNSLCASAYAAEGRNYCANLANQQVEVFKQQLAQAEQAASAASIHGDGPFTFLWLAWWRVAGRGVSSGGSGRAMVGPRLRSGGP